MCRTSWVSIPLLALLLSCVPSLHPIYTEEDVIFDPELLGTWSEGGSEETWAFSAHEPRSYRLLVTDDEGRQGRFVVHLAEIDGKRFLDLFPEQLNDEMNDFYKQHFLQVHTFLFLEEIEPRLRMAPMDHDWLSEYLQEHPNAIGHEEVGDQIVFTAPTKELQNFVLQHLRTEGAFDEPSNLLRRVAAQ